MPYDERLAARVRDALGDVAAEEKKMFGGVAFMVNTHMACGLIKDDLMVRVGPEGYDAALRRGAREMTVFSGRPMRGMVLVPGGMLADDAELRDWVGQGVSWALAEPAKAPKATRPARAAMPRTTEEG